MRGARYLAKPLSWREEIVNTLLAQRVGQHHAIAIPQLHLHPALAVGLLSVIGRLLACLGNPLNAAIWLAQDLARAGLPLKRGDLLSLGSFTKLTPPKPGLVVTARYEGLPGNPQVVVKFK